MSRDVKMNQKVTFKSSCKAYIKEVKENWKEKLATLFIDIICDIAGGILIAVGLYNFASAMGFPMVGFNGLALIVFQLYRIPMGMFVIAMNIPAILICYRRIGKRFLARSFKTMIITSVIIDYIAPMFPVYTGDTLLAAVCCAAISAIGYAIIYMRDSSTGGTDFLMMAIRSIFPHVSFGNIMFGLDAGVVLLGTMILYKNADSFIYGIIIATLMSIIVDKLMYRTNSGKVTLIVTEKGQLLCDAISEETGRGSTILNGYGSYTGQGKEVIMCACDNKQMYGIRKLAKRIDPNCFFIIMESNDVIGEGFKLN
ncbi:MAG: YitT family protein [Lachnospiraceae bacterium]|nr:YitT family protein [Lachnospiraceae bacterium]